MEKKRSVGVTIFGIVFISIGGLLFYWLDFPFVCSLIKNRFDLRLYIHLGPLGRIHDFIEILHMAMPIIMLISGIGIMLSRSWARKMILFVFIPLIFLYSLLTTYSYVRAEGGVFLTLAVLALLFSMLITSPLIIFLNRPRVKEQFK